MARPALLALTLIAVGLRLTMVTWGLPHGPDGNFHPDETKYLDPAVRFISYYLTTRPFPLYGTSLQYTLGPLLAPLDVIARLSEDPKAWRQAAELVCRTVVALMGAAAIPLIYRFTEQNRNRSAGIIAAMLVAVAPLHALNSAVFTVDVPMATLLLLNLLLTQRAVRSQAISPYVAAGAAFGYMTGMKLSALAFLLVPAIYLSLNRKDDIGVTARQIGIYFAVAFATFAILNPQFFLGFGKLVARVQLDKRDFWDRTEPATIFESLADQWSGYLEGLGAPILVTAIAGILLTLTTRRTLLAVPLFGMILAYGMYFGHFMLPRYTIFMTPIFCFFSALFLSRLIDARHASVRISGMAVLVASILYTGYVTGAGVISKIYDPRIVAADFIASRFPAGTTIGYAIESEEYPNTHLWRFPAIYREDHVRSDVLDSPDVIVTSSALMGRVRKALSSDHMGPDFMWHPDGNTWWYRYSPPSPALFQLYDRLLSEDGFRLVRSFGLPVPRDLAAEFVMREISIYERESPES